MARHGRSLLFPRFAVALAAALLAGHAAAAAKPETRCGWFINPTPATPG